MSTAPTGHHTSLHDRRIEETCRWSRLRSSSPSTRSRRAGRVRVIRSRDEVTAILDREDPRLLVIVGPCSVHDPVAALDYAHRLAALAEELPDLLVVMRVYFEKPRTTTGWKGLINDPHLDDSGDVNAGLRTARRLLLEVLEIGLPVGCEFLDPITPQYIADTVAWGAIGARTTESQTIASSPPACRCRSASRTAPTATSGRRRRASRGRRRHSFAGVELGGGSAILRTTGNDDCHIILRGGRGTTNFDADRSPTRSSGCAQSACRSGSSSTPPTTTAARTTSVSRRSPRNRRRRSRPATRRSSASCSSRSSSAAARSRTAALTYGQSVTDTCMDWDTTVACSAASTPQRGARRRERLIYGLDHVARVGPQLRRRLAVVAERPVALGDRRADAVALGALDEPLGVGVFRIRPSRIGPSVWVEARPMFS